MKKLLIIYAHWHPANLAGVHRPRLIGNYLSEFGWCPRILTVSEKYYEEEPDHEFKKFFSSDFVVTRTQAFPVIKPRLIGDIGLRSFYFLYRNALKIIREEKIDFIWIPIPSFYQAVLGRLLHEKTSVPYGIDYIDPWIRNISGNKSIRALLSNHIARILEPYAIKKASLISGVSTPYYQAVLDKNFKDKTIEHVGMPYGFDPNDHKIKIENLQNPWDKFDSCKPIIYAGACLPKSGLFIKLFFKVVRELRIEKKWDAKIHLFFIGTGNYLHKSIKSYAEDAGVENIVTEIRDRKPFLHILNYLDRAWRLMIIGTTEKHYTASKTFQALLSTRPVLAMFHNESSAVEIMQEVNADKFTFMYSEEMSEKIIVEELRAKLINFLRDDIDWNPDLEKLDKYSARNSARLLVEKLNKIVNVNNK